MHPILPRRRYQIRELRSRIPEQGCRNEWRARSNAGTGPIQRSGKARPIKPMLDPDGSAASRDQLLADMNRLSSADAAAAWAHRIMAAKNRLAAVDARRIEDAFVSKMATIGTGDAEAVNAPLFAALAAKSARSGTASVRCQARRQKPARVTGAASVSRQDPRQIRCQATLSDFWAPAGGCTSPSVCQHPALGRKVSDEFIVPLCRGHHREVHRFGDEAGCWKKAISFQPSPPARCGWRPIRCRQLRTKRPRWRDFRRHVDTDPSKAKRGRARQQAMPELGNEANNLGSPNRI